MIMILSDQDNKRGRDVIRCEPVDKTGMVSGVTGDHKWQVVITDIVSI